MQTRDMYLHFTRSNIWANGNNSNFSSRMKIRSFPMLFNRRTLIFKFSRTQVRIAEIERLQSLFKISMCTHVRVGLRDIGRGPQDQEPGQQVCEGRARRPRSQPHHPHRHPAREQPQGGARGTAPLGAGFRKHSQGSSHKLAVIKNVQCLIVLSTAT